MKGCLGVLVRASSLRRTSSNRASCASISVSIRHIRSSLPSGGGILYNQFSTAAGEDAAATNPAPKKMKRVKIETLHRTYANPSASLDDSNKVLVQGWVRTVRDQKNFAFIEMNDGSSIKGLQVIADLGTPGYAEVANLSTGAAVEATGVLVRSPGKGQSIEMRADNVKLIGSCPPEYPLQKKKHSLEYLRTISHIRGRSNLISAVARVRSRLAFAAHSFFQSEGFLFLQTPLITSSDCEGAGQMFRVTTLPIDQPDKMPIIPKPDNNSSSDSSSNKSSDSTSSDSNSNSNNSSYVEGKHPQTDFSKDFFGKPSFLTVSGQLSAEAYACGMGDVYTFGPTFRAEQSQTARHLAEFHMIEPEMAFADLHDAMDNAEKMVKHLACDVLQACRDDFAFLDSFVEQGLVSRVQILADKHTPFARISYREAVSILQKEIRKNPKKWQYPIVQFGTDLQTEHERFLAEVHFKGCVFVHNYPREIKSFYMRDSDKDPGTVDSFDLLVPGVGELVGGSQREERLEVLRAKLIEFKLKPEDYWWYLDLRRFGSCPHSGYGLGFERLVAYLTGIQNIREAIAFPRVAGSAEF